MPDISTLPLKEQCEAIWQATREREEADARSRRQPPLMRIWNGDFELQGILSSEYSAEFTWIDNDAGAGVTEIPLSDPIAKWIWQVKDRIESGERRNVFITVDKDGARWSGILNDHTVEKREDGSRVLVVRWMHDMVFLKYYQVWSNPFVRRPRLNCRGRRAKSLIPSCDRTISAYFFPRRAQYLGSKNSAVPERNARAAIPLGVA